VVIVTVANDFKTCTGIFHPTLRWQTRQSLSPQAVPARLSHMQSVWNNIGRACKYCGNMHRDDDCPVRMRRQIHKLMRTEDATAAAATARAGTTIPTFMHMAAPGNPPAAHKRARRKDGRYSTSRRVTDVGGSATMPTDVVTQHSVLPLTPST
jgi:hypothetical protein